MNLEWIYDSYYYSSNNILDYLNVNVFYDWFLGNNNNIFDINCPIFCNSLFIEIIMDEDNWWKSWITGSR